MAYIERMLEERNLHRSTSTMKGYELYKPEKRWYVLEIIKLLTISIITAFCFYDSWIGIIFSIPMIIYLYKEDYRENSRKKIKDFLACFRELMLMVNSNINAGSSLENAWIEAGEKMISDGGFNKILVYEVRTLCNGLSFNQDIEKLFCAMGERTNIEEVINLAELIKIAKIHGGDMCQLIANFTNSLSNKKILEEELDTMMSAKKYESLVMIIMPYVIALYMRITGDGYMDILYRTIVGRVVMTVSLGIVFLSIVLIRNIIASNKL